jgi:cytochrome c556
MALLDDDAFEAALRFLDAYELEEANTEGHGEAELRQTPLYRGVESKQGEDKLRRKKLLNERRKMLRRTGVYGDPNRSRNERKTEIAVLREQVQQLQLSLESLQSKEAERSKKQDVENGEEAALPKVWQEMAMRQRRRREDSESENSSLKIVAKQQQQVADSLRSLLKKRATRLVMCLGVWYCCYRV